MPTVYSPYDSYKTAPLPFGRYLSSLWPYFKSQELARLESNKLWIGQSVRLSGVSSYMGRWELLDRVYFPLSIHHSEAPIGIISDVRVSNLYLEEQFRPENDQGLLKCLEQNESCISSQETCIPIIQKQLDTLRNSFTDTGSTLKCLCYYSYTINFTKDKSYSTVRYPLCESFLSSL
jgi:hypothetical protein